MQQPSNDFERPCSTSPTHALFQLHSPNTNYGMREALECHRRVLLDDADNLAVLNNLGACLMSTGRQQEAVEAFQRAVTVCPTSTEARINLGRAFLGLRRSQEAMDCFEQLLAREPQSPQGHHYLGQAPGAGRPA